MVIWVFGRVVGYSGVDKVVLCLFIIYENYFRTKLKDELTYKEGGMRECYGFG